MMMSPNGKAQLVRHTAGLNDHMVLNKTRRSGFVKKQGSREDQEMPGNKRSYKSSVTSCVPSFVRPLRMTKLDKGPGSPVGNRSPGVLTPPLAEFTNLPIPNLHCHNLLNNHKQPVT